MWSSQYDAQPGNLMLDLDEILFSQILNNISIGDKIIVDIGCGTGRHWEKLYANQPAKVIGYDVSEGMLNILKKKFPTAETHHLTSNHLEGLEKESCDIIVSTLALAHIEDIEEAFKEWTHVLKPGGQILITDYHPDALSKGGNRTFVHNGKLVAIKNNVHPLDKIKSISAKLNLKIDELIEKKIDESVKHYYEKQDALKTFEKFNGTAIIYGALMTKTDVAK